MGDNSQTMPNAWKITTPLNSVDISAGILS